MKRHGIYYVYIVKCNDGSFYTGYTQNLENRIKAHNNGYGARYLKGRVPVRLVFFKKYRYYKNALRAEKKIKKYSREKKQELIRIYDPANFADAKLNGGTGGRTGERYD